MRRKIRRRRRALAGSPAQHDEGMKNAAFNAWESFEAAAQLALAHNCSRALEYYTDGYEYRGAMNANKRWGKAKERAVSESVHGKLIDAERAADNAMKMCLVSKKK